MEINEWDPFWRCSNQHKFHSKFVFLFFFLLWCWINQHRRKSRRVKSSIHLIIAAMIVDTQRAKKMIEDDDDATHLNSLFFFSFIFASSRWTPRTNPLRIIAVWMSSQLTNWCSTAVVVRLIHLHLRNIFDSSRSLRIFMLIPSDGFSMITFSSTTCRRFFFFHQPLRTSPLSSFPLSIR